MLPVLLLAGLILALSIPGTASESATLRFLGQTEFVVDESSTAVVRLVVERVGDPVNVTALVLVRHRKRSSSMTHRPPTLIKLSGHFSCLFSDHLAVSPSSVPRVQTNCLKNHCMVFSFTSSTWRSVSAAHSWCLVR